jgi:hypothetical protein
MKLVREFKEDGAKWRRWECKCAPPRNFEIERVIWDGPSQEDLDAWLGGGIIV